MKSVLAIAALCTCSLATAAVKDFEVDYVGFFLAESNTFDPNARLKLVFEAEDTNGDGRYDVDELRSFSMGRIYVAGESCGWTSCVYDFSYTPGSLPEFGAAFGVAEDRMSLSTTVRSGEYYQIQDNYIDGDRDYSHWEWTASTQTWINGQQVSSVPEPSTYAMFGLGLLSVIAAGRRRREI